MTCPRHLTDSLCLASLLLMTACASEDLRPDFEGARALIISTTGRPDVYDPDQPPLSPDEIDSLLADGLTLDEALRLALLNSRRLQAGFMGLGIARADFVQSGLLENPTLGLSLLLPAGGGQTRIAASLAQDVMEIWRLPERRKLADASMELQLLGLARQAGELVVDTEASYYETVAAHDMAANALAGADLARRSADAVRQRVSLGVATETESSLVQSAALQADLDARNAERRVALAVRRLAGLLSLTTDLGRVRLTSKLPALVGPIPDREALVAHGLASRLDLRVLGAAVRSAEARVSLEQGRSAPDVGVGIAYERPESDDPTDHVLGPTLGIELPVFDDNAAQISRAEYELEQLRRAYEALDAELRQQVRAAVDGASLSADASRFLRGELLPQAERSADLARRAFDSGGSTLMPLLEAQQVLLEAQSAEIDSALEAALSLVDLKRALGGPLPRDAGAR